MNIVLWDKVEQTALEYGEVKFARIMEATITVRFSSGYITPFERKRFLLLDHEEETE